MDNLEFQLQELQQLGDNVFVFQIRRTISEGVAAAVRDPEMAYRLGSRAVPSLLLMLEEENLNGDDCKHVIQALAVLREQKACSAIIKRFENDDERLTAIAAMVAIGHMPPLLEAVNSPSLQIKMGAITALRRMANPESIPILVAAMNGADVDERENIVRALSAIGIEAHTHLIVALGDQSKPVQLAALQGLTLDRSERLMHKLIEMANSDDADVRLAVIDAMQRFSDGRVVAPLASALDDEDHRVAKQAQRSLDYLESVVASKGTSSDQ